MWEFGDQTDPGSRASSKRMDLLGGYGSGSDVSDEESASAPARSSLGAKPSAGASFGEDESSSDDDASRLKEAAKKKKRPAPKSLLPSADDLFASTSGPAFLAGPKEEFVLETKKKQRAEVLPEPAAPQAAAAPVPAPPAKASSKSTTVIKSA